MKLPDRVLPDSVMFGFRDFDVQGFLEGINSPRLGERYRPGIRMPGDAGLTLAELVLKVCKEHDANPMGLLAKLQGETSFLTARKPPGKGYLAPMGYGCPDGGADPPAKWAGPYNNIEAAAKWWGGFRSSNWDWARRLREGMPVNVAASGQPFHRAVVIPRSIAEVAYLLYTPHVYSVHDFWGLLDRHRPLTIGEAGTMPTGGPTTKDMAEVALAAGSAGESGQNNHRDSGVTFNLQERGMCQRFARQVTAAALKRHYPEVDEWDHQVIPHSAASAKKAEQRLLAGSTSTLCPVQRVQVPTPGCLGYCRNNGPYGHVVVFLGRGEVAENTASRRRGPGTVLSALEDISGITSWWRILPRGATNLVDDLKVVLDGDVVACNPEEVDGATIVDFWPVVQALGIPAELVVFDRKDGHLVDTVGVVSSSARVNLRSLVTPWGWEPHWKAHDDGRQRVYLKPADPPSDTVTSA